MWSLLVHQNYIYARTLPVHISHIECDGNYSFNSGINLEVVSDHVPWRKVFYTMPPVTTVRFLDLMDPSRNHTTQSMWNLIEQIRMSLFFVTPVKELYDGTPGSRTIKHPTLLIDCVTIYWRSQTLQLQRQFFVPKNTLWQPLIGSQVKIWAIDKRLSISNRLACQECEVTSPFPFPPPPKGVGIMFLS